MNSYVYDIACAVLAQLDAGLETSKAISRLLKRYCRLEENFAKEVHTVLNEGARGAVCARGYPIRRRERGLEVF